jgi:hypothetical protein
MRREGMAQRQPQPPKGEPWAGSRYPLARRGPAPRRRVADALEHDYRREVDEASATLKLAEDLFVELVVRQHAEASTPSATRTAVSCLLLEQVCAVFGRYHSVLSVVADNIMRSVYVPNTPENRELLNGSVLSTLALPSSLPEQAADMLQPYARKTYFQAYEEISDALSQYSQSNRSIEIRLSRQTKVFDHTMKHWMTSIQRNFFLSWRTYTKRRHQLRAKYRAIFFRVRSDECKIKAIRRWRDRAARIKKAAMVDAASADELQALHVALTHMQGQVETLTEYNTNLSKQISEQETRRGQLQSEIDERQQLAAEMQNRATEVERLGTELIDSALIGKLPPAGSTPLEVLVNWAHGIIEQNGGTVDGTVNPLQALIGDDYVVDVPYSALGSVMMGFAGDKAPPRESIVQLHLDNDNNSASRVVSMWERLTGRPCVVSEEQLSTGQRGVVLLFLAGLMRFATQWLLCPSPAPVGAHAVAPRPPPATWAERIAIHQKWILASFAAQNAALTVAVQHPVALSTEEAADQKHFLELPIKHVTDVLPLHHAERRHLELLKAARKVYVDIRRLYVAYSMPVMTFADLIRLLKDCYLLGDRKLPRKQVEAIAKAAWKNAGKDVPTNAPATGEGVGATEITKLQFTEILIRLCHAELKRTAPDEAGDMTAKHLTALITDRIAAHALRSDIDKFKQVVRHPAVQAVLQQHRIAMRNVFSKYATSDDRESMNRVGFQRMARDCEWITRTVSMDAVNDVFKRVQSAEQGSVETLDLLEWIECICAMAVYHNPNPFKPLAAKLGQFIEDRVLTANAM